MFLNFANRQTDGISGNDLQTSSVQDSRLSPDTDPEEWSGTPNDAFMWGKSSMERTYPGPGGQNKGLPPGFFHRDISLPLNLDSMAESDISTMTSQSEEQLLRNVDRNQDDRDWIGHGLRITTSSDFTTGPITHFFE